VAYALIKLASFDQIQLEPVPLNRSIRLRDKWAEKGESLRHTTPPAADMYFVPGGPEGEVLILLAHWHIVDDPKSNIGRVIQFAQTSGKSCLTACIFSIETVIVVRIIIEGDKTFVRHTHPKEGSFWSMGQELLASVLSSSHIVSDYQLDSVLPSELIERIFQNLCQSSGTSIDILSWRLTCKAFNQLANLRTISLKSATICNLPTSDEDILHVRDQNGMFGTYRTGETAELGLTWRPIDKETKEPIGLCVLNLERCDER
jgi:hypothetical protein